MPETPLEDAGAMIPNQTNIAILGGGPAGLEAALAAMDTDNDGHIDVDEWCVSELYNLGCLRRGDDALR